MTVVTIDSTDTAAILADAGVELEQPAEKPEEGEKQEAKPADKGVAGDEDPDDVEDEDGLTPAQKREFSHKMQKTISRKHRMQKEAEEFAAAQYSEKLLAEQRADRLEKELAAERAKSAPPEAPKAPEKPKRENYANEYEYVDAMIQFGVDERLREKAAEDAKAAEKRAADERIDAAKKRINHAIELVPDFVDVINEASDKVGNLSPAISTYLEESEMVAELTYHFAKNPDVLVSLMKLSPHSQLVKIGKIESTLSPFGSEQTRKESSTDSASSGETSNGRASKAAPSESDTGTAPSKPRGKAAPVITPLDGTGSAGIHKDSKDMNIREAIEDYQKRNRANLGVRKRH